jgi:hypothetical protein
MLRSSHRHTPWPIRRADPLRGVLESSRNLIPRSAERVGQAAYGRDGSVGGDHPPHQRNKWRPTQQFSPKKAHVVVNDYQWTHNHRATHPTPGSVLKVGIASVFRKGSARTFFQRTARYSRLILRITRNQRSMSGRHQLLEQLSRNQYGLLPSRRLRGRSEPPNVGIASDALILIGRAVAGISRGQNVIANTLNREVLWPGNEIPSDQPEFYEWGAGVADPADA